MAKNVEMQNEPFSSSCLWCVNFIPSVGECYLAEVERCATWTSCWCCLYWDGFSRWIKQTFFPPSFLPPVFYFNFFDKLVQIPVIPEDIFFTSEFTVVAKLEDVDDTSAGLVSKTFNQVVFVPKMYKLSNNFAVSCCILGQHGLGWSTASLHMLSIPGQVFVTWFHKLIASIELT